MHAIKLLKDYEIDVKLSYSLARVNQVDVSLIIDLGESLEIPVHVDTYNNWGRKKYLRIGSGWNGHEINGYDYYYHPCYTTHEAESDSGFLTGYYMDDMSTRRDDKIPVTVWTDYGTDVHCTTKLDQSSWETAKS